MNCNEVLIKSPSEVLEWLDQDFNTFLPEYNSDTYLNQVGELLNRFTNELAYLYSLKSFVEIEKRNAKREKNNILSEDLIDKEKTISNRIEVVSTKIKTLSRSLTVKQIFIDEFKLANNI